MMHRHLFLLFSFTIFLLVFPSATATIGGQDNLGKHFVELEPGWNLVKLDVFEGKIDTDCLQLSKVWGYTPKKDSQWGRFTWVFTNQGRKLQPYDVNMLVAGTQLEVKDDDALHRSKGMWVKNNGQKCVIQYNPNAISATIYPGWNILGVGINWAGKNLNDVKGTCRIGKAWSYKTTQAEFEEITTSKQFDESEIGSAIWVRYDITQEEIDEILENTPEDKEPNFNCNFQY